MVIRLLKILKTKMDKSRIFALVLFIFGLVNIPAFAAQTISTTDPENTTQVKRGKIIYHRFCSLCHGKNLQGQANWRIRKPNGKLPAPPHDDAGHTWHHADDLLFGIVKFGLVPPYAPKNYESDMPAWGSTLKDDDIWAVLTFIKSRWSDETRKIQLEIDNDSRKQ